MTKLISILVLTFALSLSASTAAAEDTKTVRFWRINELGSELYTTDGAATAAAARAGLERFSLTSVHMKQAPVAERSEMVAQN